MKNDDVESEIERMSNNRIKGLEICYETADRITLCNMMEQRKYLIKELKDYKGGKYLHPEDVVSNTEIINALELLIPYYGGTND